MKKNKTLIELIIGALIFSVSLAWNNAFQNAFEEIPYLKIYGPWVYALLVTITVFYTIKFLHKIYKF